MVSKQSESKEIAIEANKSTFDDAQLAQIKDMDTALAALGSITDIEDWSDYGSGFDVLDNKDRLVGVPFVILEWRFTHSKKFDGTFVSAVVVDENNNKFIVNDGSTGLYAQLQSVTDQRIAAGRPMPQTGLVVKKGLRRSDYETEVVDAKGKASMIEASTYYLG